MPATAVVFDVGNVLYHWDPRNLYRRMMADDAALEAFIAETAFVDWHFQLDGGRTFAECAGELTARFPHHKALIDAWGPRFNESIGTAVAGMHRLVADLDDARVPLFAITNFSGEFWGPFRDTDPDLFGRFRDILVSGTEKLAKPDPRIFELALRRFELVGDDALFIDDLADNVEAALAAGMRAHLFIDANDLRARLVEEALLQA